MPDLIPILLISQIFIPFMGALLIFVVGKKLIAPIAWTVALLLPLIALGLAAQEMQIGAVSYPIGGWKAPLGIELVYDGLSSVMLVMVSVIAACVTLYSLSFYQKRLDRIFWTLWLIVWGGLNALFLSGDIFNLYVTLEVMTFAAIGLALLKGTAEALIAGGRYLFFTLFGSLTYLMGVALLYAQYGVLDIEALGDAVRPLFATYLAFALITAGLSVKAALFPFHNWLPSTHANAPSPVSAVLSSLIITAPFYLLVRLWFTCFIPIISPVAADLAGLLGTVSILWGASQALRQSRLKLVIAYSTIAQVGYLFLVFPLCSHSGNGGVYAWSGGIYFALSHALAKAAAFLAAGSIIYKLGHDNISQMSGLSRSSPLSVFTFALAGMSLIGMPPSGGFVAKWLLLKSAMYSGQWIYAAVILAGGLLAAAYIFRVLEVTLREESINLSGPKVPLGMEYAALALSLAALFMGLAGNTPLKILKTHLPPSFDIPKEFFP